MEAKIKAIRDYLKKQFPNAYHKDEYDLDRAGHKFGIETKDHFLLTLVARELIDDHDSDVIISKLDTNNIRDLLNNHPESNIIVNSTGVKIEPRN